jgi:tetratricopeptide (TPR) repeat protein
VLNRKTDRIADAVRLLGALGAVVADPTLLSAIKAGPGGYDALKRLAAAPPQAVARLSDDLAARARALFDATRELPADADVLYLQMVEAGLVAAPEIVAAGMDAHAVTEAMVAKLTEREHRTGAMLDLFRRLTEPALRRVLADNAFADDLRAAFMAEVLRQLGDLNGRLEQVDRLTRLEMTALGDRFEIMAMHALSDADLRDALEKRAEDWRALKARIEGIDERTAGLGNLKAAAKEAAARLDFEEVERLLSRVDEAQTEIAAESKVLRAENALLRGRPKEAFACLSAAADGFLSVDPLEPARRRLGYCGRLLNHGLRYGGDGLSLEGRMIRRALEDLSETETPELWARGQVALANALTQEEAHTGPRALYRLLKLPFGEGQTTDQQEREVFSEAIAALRNGLRVLSETENPEEWAEAQLSLSVALRQQSDSTKGSDAEEMLAEAIVACRAALRVFTIEFDAARYVRAKISLGNILKAQGTRTEAAEGLGALAEAAKVYWEALLVLQKADNVSAFPYLLYSLGNTCAEGADRTSGTAAVRLLSEATTAFRTILDIWTEDTHPTYFAHTMHRLGKALESLSHNTECHDPKAVLAEAGDCFGAAARAFGAANSPLFRMQAILSVSRVWARRQEL